MLVWASARGVCVGGTTLVYGCVWGVSGGPLPHCFMESVWYSVGWSGGRGELVPALCRVWMGGYDSVCRGFVGIPLGGISSSDSPSLPPVLPPGLHGYSDG